ncbi:hypothetical protein [Phenylobacterium sp.]|jgi:hypothetical protein|uniref:hypothetical protein n=1 Tax=Phenylobacterium sp. TaxID=1871053 RepID=UPI002F3EACDB
MRSSTSLVLAAVALLGASLGLKIALAAPPGRDVQAPVSRGEALRRFLVAHAGPVEPVSDGWRFSREGCRLAAFPSGRRGSLDMAAFGYAHRRGRVAYVYHGRITERRPAVALALDVIAYRIAEPFKGGVEPGYVVLVAADCPHLPDLPWRDLD